MNKFNNILYQLKLKAIHAGFRLRHARQRKMLLMQLKYKLFLFDRLWSIHPVFRYTYPQPGVPRRIAVCVTAFLIVGAGYALHLYNTANADWYSTSWVYRKAITINPNKVAGNLTDFPVLISTIDTSLAANARADGNDILFTKADGTTKLKHEIEKFATTSGQLTAWVKVPSVSSTSATTIYMYYGNPSAQNQQDPVNVWDSNYKVVQHMDENPASTCASTNEICDSTINHFDFNANGTMTSSDQVPGIIEGSIDFDGTDDYFNNATSPIGATPSNNVTMSAWVLMSSPTFTDGAGIVQVTEGLDPSGGTSFLELFLDGSNALQYDSRATSFGTQNTVQSNMTYNYSQWHYVTGQLNASGKLRLYIDGVDSGDSNPSVPALTGFDTTAIGADVDTGGDSTTNPEEFFKGQIDEVRISNTGRSASWIKTEYNNQASPSAFFTVGNQQQKKNPVLLWKFDEGSGSTANDTSGKNNSGVISGATWQNKDVCLFEGNCLKFDGTNDYVRKLHDGSADAWCNDTNGLRGCTATWSARMKITFTGNRSTTNLTSFPVLVKLDSTRVDYSKMQTAGQDIRFVDPSDPNTVLAHEIDSWTNNGTSYVWVKVPQIDANSTSDYIWMYYGNSATPFAQNPRQVWTNGYVGVWHLNEDPAVAGAGGIKDATTNFNNGTDAGTSAMNATDKVGGIISTGIDFNGVDQRIDLGTPASLALNNTTTTTWTISAWAKPANFADRCPTIYTYGLWTADIEIGSSVSCTNGTPGDVTTSHNNTQEVSENITVLNEWNYIAATKDSSNQKIYLNGELDATVPTASINTDASGSTIGCDTSCSSGTDGPYTGSIDEVRVSNVTRSSDWMRAEYMTSIDQFSTYATEGTNAKMDPDTGSFSVGAWFRHPTTISGTDTIIARTDALNGVGYKVYFGATEGLCFGIDGTAGSFPSDKACSTNTYNDNKWHYVEGVKNGTSSITLYVDGQQTNQDSSITSSSLTGTSPPFYVGMDADGSTNPYDGFLDEIRVYDYARSATEIKADYNAKGGVLGLSTVAGVSDQRDALSNGLIGYWKMDDGVNMPCKNSSDVTVVDRACESSGNGNYGSWTNGVASTSGKFGNATKYDGVNDYLQMNSTYTVSNSSMTISYWFNPSALPASTFDNNILAQRQTAGNFDADWGTTVGTTGSVGFYASKNAYATYSACNSTDTVTTDTWNLYTAVVDNSKLKVSIYLNGKLDTTCDLSAPLNDNGSTSLRAGYQWDAANNKYYNGKLDDVRIYNRALSVREITNLYNWAPAPFGYWKFDEKTGTTAKDSSGYGNSAVLDSGVKWVGGKYGSALQFNNDAATVDSTNIKQPVNAVTVAAWVNIQDHINWNNIVGRQWYDPGTNSWLLYSDSSGEVFFGVSDAVPDQYNAGCNCSLDNNRWYHLEGTYDGTTVSLYVDGVLVATDTRAGLSFTPVSSFSFGNGYVKVDDVKMYDYARTPKQVVMDMNGGHPAVGSPVGSPLVHLKFDDGYGNIASNSGSLGSRANGQLILHDNPATDGSGWTNDGKYGKALNFDGPGSDERVLLPDIPELDLTDQMTVSAWVRSRVAPDTQYRRIFSRNHSPSQEWFVEFEGTAPFGRLAYEGVSGDYSKQQLVANKWYHVVMTRDGTTSKIYINGKLDSSIADSGSLGTLGQIAIGGDDNGTTTWEGTIDEAKIYDYALSQNEVQLDYNNGKAVQFGSLSTNPDNYTGSNSAARRYCPPGNADSNCAGTKGLNPAPVAEWKFDERKGNIAQDTSGYGNNGVITGTNKWVSGKVGAALDFDGSTTSVNAGSGSKVDDVRPVTFSTWIYPRSAGEGSAGRIVHKSSNNNPNSGYIFYVQSDGSLKFDRAYLTQDLNRWTSANAIRFGQWNHVELTWDGSVTAANVHIYVNGIEQQYTTTTDGSGSIEADNGQDLYIGNGILGDRTFDGVIDDMKVYSYVRSQAQVAWDYNRGQPMAKYQFDECTGNTIYNSVSSPTATWSASLTYGTRSGTGGSNLTSGTCSSSDTSHAWYNGVTGKFNSSLDFDGTDDVVQITDNNFGNFGANQDFTLSAWVKTTQSDTAANKYPMIFFKQRTAANRTGYALLTHVAEFDTKWHGEIYVGGTSTRVAGASTISDGNWHHLVFLRSGSTIKTYQDGKPAGTVSVSSSDLSTASNLTIGGGNNDADLQFDGQIDDSMIFNYALSPAQIKVLYNQYSAVRFGPTSGRP